MDGRTDILGRHSPRYAYASRGKKINRAVVNSFIIVVNFAKILGALGHTIESKGVGTVWGRVAPSHYGDLKVSIQENF